MDIEQLNSAYRQAQQLVDKNDLAQAMAVLNNILQFYPNQARVLTYLASIQTFISQLDEANANLQKALKSDPNDAEVYYQLGQLFLKLQNPHVALGYFHKAFKLNPTENIVYFYLSTRQSIAESRLDFMAVRELLDEFILKYPQNHKGFYLRSRVLCELGETQGGLNDLDSCLALSPDNQHAWVRKALILNLLGDYAEGWRCYEYRLGLDSSSVKSPVSDLPRWKGEPLAPEQTLVIYTEQGLGDNIQFLRYAFEAKKRGMNIAVWNAPALQGLLGYNLSRYGIATLQQGEKISKSRYCQVSMMSLPYYFGTRLDTISYRKPYLQVQPDFQTKWQHKITPSSKLKVGIAWAGSKTNARDHQRSIALTELMPILMHDVEFHCLQKEISVPDKKRATVDLTNMKVWDQDLNDFSDTAGLIAQLDLIITIDSSVAHLAAAMGKPTWVMINYFPDFRWLLDRDDCVWYDDVRLFRQDNSLLWAPVIQKVGNALAETLAQR